MNKAKVKNALFFAAGVIATNFVYANFLRDKVEPHLNKLIGK